MSLTKKQKDVFQFIVSYSDTHGIVPTQKEIKEHFGLKSFGSVQRYLKYLNQAGLIEQDWNAVRGLKIVKNPFVSPSSPKVSAIDQSGRHKEYYQQSTIELDLLGTTAAGAPLEAIESDEKIHVPASMVKNQHPHFALQVEGDSMIEAGILSGDILICQKSTHAQNGEIAVVTIDHHATVKYFYHYPDRIELVPANSRLKTTVIPQENLDEFDESFDFAIKGKVVALYRQYS